MQISQNYNYKFFNKLQSKFIKSNNSINKSKKKLLFKYSENLNNNTAILNRSLLQKTSALSPLMYDDYFNDIHFHDIGDDEFFPPPDDKPKVLL